MQPLRVGVLGPLAARREGAAVSLGSPMLRTMLGLLAVHPHQVVSRDEIVDTLWGEDPPPTCVASVHVYIGRLRTLAEPGRAPREHGLIRAVGSHGYIFEPGPGQLDLLDYRALADAAWQTRQANERSPAAATAGRLAVALADALRCWRGPALAGIGGRLERHPAVTALTERRTATVLAHADAALALPADAGQAHREHALGLLRELAHEAPLHEGVHARLMLMLAASGQQAAALSTYVELRTRLADELGVDPGRELTDAHLRVLRGDEDGAERITLDVPRPAQLPLDVEPFTGRGRELAELDATLTGPATGTRVALLTGTPGVGKSALAVHWAHRASAGYPDGQLFVRLRGYARTAPMRPIEALAQVLRSLGVAPGEVPIEPDEAANLYRSLLTGKRMLVLLDNASSPDQVRPLLPGTPGCTVLVTSRDRLAGLAARDGARPINLDVLSAAEAQTLLAGTLGPERTRREPDAVAELARTCAYLPLALRIAAANLQSRPHLGIASYVARLREENPVSALAVDGDEETAVRGAFDLSYRALPAPAQRLFRLLGSMPGPDIAEGGVAALAGLGLGEANRLLDTLCGAHLANQQADGRYALHDLLRGYAVALAEEQGPAAEREAPAERLTAWYLRGVAAATTALYPERLRLPSPGDADPLPFADPAEALAWLDAERAGLLAAAAQADGPTAWLLMDGLRAYCGNRVPTVDWLALTRAGMSAAERADDPFGLAAAHLSRAEIALRRGEYGDAITHYESVVQLSRRAGWLGGEAAALGNLGLVCRFSGRVTDAVTYSMQSLELNRRAGRLPSQAMVLGSLGIAQRELGNLDLAAAHLTKAKELFDATGSVGGRAMTLDNLGEVYVAQGRLAEAQAAAEEALELFRGIGSKLNEAAALRVLAMVRCEQGDLDAALAAGTRALELARETADRRTEMGVLNGLGAVHQRAGRTAEARGHHLHALRLARDTGHRHPEALALVGLADLHERAGEPELAVTWAQQALGIIVECGYRLLEPRAAEIAALPTFALGERD